MSRSNSNTNTPAQSDGEDDDIQILEKAEVEKIWGENKATNEPESATQNEFQPMKPTRIKRKHQRYFEKLEPRQKETKVETKPPAKEESAPIPFVPKPTRIYYATRTYVDALAYL
jgi:hypothetical protein